MKAFAGLLCGLLVLACGAAQAGEEGSRAGGASPEPEAVPAQAPPTLEGVEVTAKREALRRALGSFVSQVTPVDGTNIARWRDPVCPWVTAGTTQEAEFIAARIRAIAEGIGAKGGQSGKCDANLLVFLTDQPDQLVRELKGRSPRVFAGVTQQRVNLESDASYPVRVWQSAPRKNTDGSPTISNPNSPPEHRLKDSRIVSGVAGALAATIVVVDTRRTGRATFGQLSDYIAMVALARIDLDAELADAPSILQLFGAAPGVGVPSGLTEWDQAFLESVYGLRDAYHHERSVIVTRMLQQLEPAS